MSCDGSFGTHAGHLANEQDVAATLGDGDPAVAKDVLLTAFDAARGAYATRMAQRAQEDAAYRQARQRASAETRRTLLAARTALLQRRAQEDAADKAACTRMFAEIRARGLPYPSHTTETDPTYHVRFPRPDALYAYARTQELIEAARTGVRTPLAERVLALRARRAGRCPVSAAPSTTAAAPDTPPRGPEDADGVRLVMGPDYDSGGFLRCRNCGQFASPVRPHLCRQVATTGTVMRFLKRRLGVPLTAYDSVLVADLLAEARARGTVVMVHGLTGARVATTLDGVLVALQQGYVPERWRDEEGLRPAVTPDGRVVAVTEMTGLTPAPRLRSVYAAAAAASGVALPSDAVIDVAGQPLHATRPPSEAPRVRLSGGEVYDRVRVIGTEYRRAAQLGLPIEVCGQRYVIGERRLEPEHWSRARRASLIADPPASGAFAGIAVGRTLPMAVELLRTHRVEETPEGLVELYDPSGARLIAVYDPTTRRAGAMERLESDGDSPVTAAQMAAVLAHWVRRGDAGRPATDLRAQIVAALREDLAAAHAGSGSGVRAADSAALLVLHELADHQTLTFGAQVAAPRCQDCGQFRGSSHACPATLGSHRQRTLVAAASQELVSTWERVVEAATTVCQGHLDVAAAETLARVAYALANDPDDFGIPRQRDQLRTAAQVYLNRREAYLPAGSSPLAAGDPVPPVLAQAATDLAVLLVRQHELGVRPRLAPPPMIATSPTLLDLSASPLLRALASDEPMPSSGALSLATRRMLWEVRQLVRDAEEGAFPAELVAAVARLGEEASLPRPHLATVRTVARLVVAWGAAERNRQTMAEHGSPAEAHTPAEDRLGVELVRAHPRLALEEDGHAISAAERQALDAAATAIAADPAAYRAEVVAAARHWRRRPNSATARRLMLALGIPPVHPTRAAMAALHEEGTPATVQRFLETHPDVLGIANAARAFDRDQLQVLVQSAQAVLAGADRPLRRWADAFVQSVSSGVSQMGPTPTQMHAATSFARALAEEAGCARCPSCGQFVGQGGHTCPPEMVQVAQGVFRSAWTLLDRLNGRETGPVTDAERQALDAAADAIHALGAAATADIPAELQRCAAELVMQRGAPAAAVHEPLLRMATLLLRSWQPQMQVQADAERTIRMRARLAGIAFREDEIAAYRLAPAAVVEAVFAQHHDIADVQRRRAQLAQALAREAVREHHDSAQLLRQYGLDEPVVAELADLPADRVRSVLRAIDLGQMPTQGHDPRGYATTVLRRIRRALRAADPAQPALPTTLRERAERDQAVGQEPDGSPADGGWEQEVRLAAEDEAIVAVANGSYAHAHAIPDVTRRHLVRIAHHLTAAGEDARLSPELRAAARRVGDPTIPRQDPDYLRDLMRMAAQVIRAGGAAHCAGCGQFVARAGIHVCAAAGHLPPPGPDVATRAGRAQPTLRHALDWADRGASFADLRDDARAELIQIAELAHRDSDQVPPELVAAADAFLRDHDHYADLARAAQRLVDRAQLPADGRRVLELVDAHHDVLPDAVAALTRDDLPMPQRIASLRAVAARLAPALLAAPPGAFPEPIVQAAATFQQDPQAAHGAVALTRAVLAVQVAARTTPVGDSSALLLRIAGASAADSAAMADVAPAITHAVLRHHGYRGSEGVRALQALRATVHAHSGGVTRDARAISATGWALLHLANGHPLGDLLEPQLRGWVEDVLADDRDRAGIGPALRRCMEEARDRLAAATPETAQATYQAVARLMLEIGGVPRCRACGQFVARSGGHDCASAARAVADPAFRPLEELAGNGRFYPFYGAIQGGFQLGMSWMQPVVEHHRLMGFVPGQLDAPLDPPLAEVTVVEVIEEAFMGYQLVDRQGRVWATMGTRYRDGEPVEVVQRQERHDAAVAGTQEVADRRPVDALAPTSVRALFDAYPALRALAQGQPGGMVPVDALAALTDVARTLAQDHRMRGATAAALTSYLYAAEDPHRSMAQRVRDAQEAVRWISRLPEEEEGMGVDPDRTTAMQIIGSFFRMVPSLRREAERAAQGGDPDASPVRSEEDRRALHVLGSVLAAREDVPADLRRLATALRTTGEQVGAFLVALDAQARLDQAMAEQRAMGRPGWVAQTDPAQRRAALRLSSAALMLAANGAAISDRLRARLLAYAATIDAQRDRYPAPVRAVVDAVRATPSDETIRALAQTVLLIGGGARCADCGQFTSPRAGHVCTVTDAATLSVHDVAVVSGDSARGWDHTTAEAERRSPTGEAMDASLRSSLARVADGGEALHADHIATLEEAAQIIVATVARTGPGVLTPELVAAAQGFLARPTETSARWLAETLEARRMHREPRSPSTQLLQERAQTDDVLRRVEWTAADAFRTSPALVHVAAITPETREAVTTNEELNVAADQAIRALRDALADTPHGSPELRDALTTWDQVATDATVRPLDARIIAAREEVARIAYHLAFPTPGHFARMLIGQDAAEPALLDQIVALANGESVDAPDLPLLIGSRTRHVRANLHCPDDLRAAATAVEQSTGSHEEWMAAARSFGARLLALAGTERCPSCGRFVGVATHTCPPSATDPAAALGVGDAAPVVAPPPDPAADAAVRAAQAAQRLGISAPNELAEQDLTRMFARVIFRHRRAVSRRVAQGYEPPPDHLLAETAQRLSDIARVALAHPSPHPSVRQWAESWLAQPSPTPRQVRDAVHAVYTLSTAAAREGSLVSVIRTRLSTNLTNVLRAVTTDDVESVSSAGRTLITLARTLVNREDLPHDLRASAELLRTFRSLPRTHPSRIGATRRFAQAVIRTGWPRGQDLVQLQLQEITSFIGLPALLPFVNGAVSLEHLPTQGDWRFARFTTLVVTAATNLQYDTRLPEQLRRSAALIVQQHATGAPITAFALRTLLIELLIATGQPRCPDCGQFTEANGSHPCVVSQEVRHAVPSPLGTAVADSTGVAYDADRLRGSEYGRRSLAGRTIESCGHAYPYQARSSDPRDQSRMRRSGAAPSAASTVGRTMLAAIDLLRSARVIEDDSTIQVYAATGHLVSVVDRRTRVVAPGDRLHAYAALNEDSDLTVEQMAGWIAYLQRAGDPDGHLAHDLRGAHDGTGSPLAAADSAYLLTLQAIESGRAPSFNGTLLTSRCPDCGRWMGDAHLCPARTGDAAELAALAQVELPPATPIPATIPAPRRQDARQQLERIDLVDINTASEQALRQLPGIGQVLARRIIQERRHRPYTSVDDLATRVTGITQTMARALDPVLTVGDIQEAQARIQQEIAEEARRAEESVRRAREAVRAQIGGEGSFTDHMDAFEQAYQEAKDRMARGEPLVPLMQTNATGGLGARNGGRGFGIEIEFVGGDLHAIGQELYRAGLVSTPVQQRYHSRGRRGYWKFERDATVSGEIVSPVLYDTPQTWQQLATVCAIVRAHGGQPSVRTGCHVHVGIGDFDHQPQRHRRLINLFAKHQDLLFRLSQSPTAENGNHRGDTWCSPIVQHTTPFQRVTDAQRRLSTHLVALNFQSVVGESGDHVEFRTFDGSLDPGTIQAQIKLALALTAAAHRMTDEEVEALEHVPRGTHLDRNPDEVPLEGEDWERQTRHFRQFLDMLFTRSEDKAQITALFAGTRWQPAPGKVRRRLWKWTSAELQANRDALARQREQQRLERERREAEERARAERRLQLRGVDGSTLTDDQVTQVVAMITSSGQVLRSVRTTEITENAERYVAIVDGNGDVAGVARVDAPQGGQADVSQITSPPGRDGAAMRRLILSRAADHARAAGARVVQTTVRPNDAATRQALVDLGWRRTGTFHNARSGNDVEVWQRTVAAQREPRPLPQGVHAEPVQPPASSVIIPRESAHLNEATADRIASLLNARTMPSRPVTGEQIRSSGSTYVLAGPEGGVPVAVAETRRVNWYQHEIRNVVVDESHEGQGYGAQIVRAAEQQAAARGARILQVSIHADHEGGRRLFARLGYERTLAFVDEETGREVEVWQRSLCPVQQVAPLPDMQPAPVAG